VCVCVCVCVCAESFRESESQNKELNRSVQELSAIRMQLQSDRDAMEAELQDSRDSIKDLQSRLDSATSVMNQLKVDLDSRLRERDEEIENLRSALVNTRTSCSCFSPTLRLVTLCFVSTVQFIYIVYFCRFKALSSVSDILAMLFLLKC